MGEKRATARYFPCDGIAEIGQVDLGNDKVRLSGEMFLQRTLQLILRRQVNVTICQINRRAMKDPVSFKLRPLRRGEYFKGGIWVALFGHAVPMPKSNDGDKAKTLAVFTVAIISRFPVVLYS